MKPRMLETFFLVILLLLSISSPSTGATPDEAASAVMARFRLTKPGFFGDFSEIGTVLMPRRDGLRANRPSKAFKPNVVKNNRLAVPGGGDLPLGGVHGGVLKQGERLHLYGVSTGDDFVQLDLYTIATYSLSGMKGTTPLQGSVRFQYEGGLAGVTTRQLLEDIGEWLEAEGGTANSAATPRAPDSPTSTIRLGQTQEEVTAIFGPPEKQILLGPKTIFIYDGVKVIFVDGKVVDAAL